MVDYDSLFRRDLPPPASRWTGLPPLNFAGGHNDPAIVPVEGLVAAAERTLREHGSKLAMYNLGMGPMGYPPLRAFIAGKLRAQRGVESSPDDILVTSGSLQGLDLVNAALLEPGDTVIVEELTYAGTITRLKRCGVEILGVPLDAGGLRTEALAAMLDRLRGKGVRPKFVYTIPTIQNPTGTVLSLARRHELLALSREHGVPIFEDECYADLLWEGDWPPALRGLARDGEVIHIGSFSKSLAPALRLGYVSAPWEVMRRLVTLKDDAGTPALEQMIVADYFGSHFEAHVTELKRALRAKLEILTDALAEAFGTAAEWGEASPFGASKGGIFLWVRLPEPVDTTRLARLAAAEGLAFNAGAEWSTDPLSARRSLRLCFALPSPETLRRGVAALADICHREFGVPERSGNRIRR